MNAWYLNSKSDNAIIMHFVHHLPALLSLESLPTAPLVCFCIFRKGIIRICLVHL